MLNHILDRLSSRLQHVLQHVPLDLDFLDFTCTQEYVLLNAISSHVPVSPAISDAISELQRLIHFEKENNEVQMKTLQFEQGLIGRPRAVISQKYILKLLELNLNIKSIAALLGVSRCTVQRWMAEWNISVQALYSELTDEELDQSVREIKSRQPNAGYKMMKALLQAEGHRLQYDRVRASLHRVDTVGVVARMTQLGCIVRRTYSVPGPQSLMHIDTNHKLIR